MIILAPRDVPFVNIDCQRRINRKPLIFSNNFYFFAENISTTVIFKWIFFVNANNFSLIWVESGTHSEADSKGRKICKRNLFISSTCERFWPKENNLCSLSSHQIIRSVDPNLLVTGRKPLFLIVTPLCKDFGESIYDCFNNSLTEFILFILSIIICFH